MLEAVDWLRQGDLAAFLQKDLDQNTGAPPLPIYEGLSLSLDGMLQEIHEVYGTFTITETGSMSIGTVYKSAIQALKNMMANAGVAEGLIARTIGWPVLINPHFIGLLRRGDPTALIILAHYGALFTSINHVWFARGLGSRLVKAVVGVLGMHKFLTEPLAWAN